jgi:hypothetical protein
LSAYAPYYLDSRGWGMDQAFMLMVRAPPTEPPTDDELAGMKLTRSQTVALVAKLKARQWHRLLTAWVGSWTPQANQPTSPAASFPGAAPPG